MANLTFLEKRNFEKLLCMSGGYVLDFSNRTFQEFIADTTGRDIFDSKYDYGSGSKANRLRGFWAQEPNHVVGKLLSALLDCCATTIAAGEPDLHSQCRRIAERLIQDAPVVDAEVISEVSVEKDFDVVAKAVGDSIERNELDEGLDRLHTFTIKYVRHLCEKHGITVDRDKPLHSLFGEYVKQLKKEGLLDSVMAERILKSSISTLEAFSDVRNNQSLAHDNPILNYSESLLIFNHVVTCIRFLHTIEKPRDAQAKTDQATDDIPF